MVVAAAPAPKLGPMGHSNGPVWILNESIGLQSAALEVARVIGLPIHLKTFVGSQNHSIFPGFCAATSAA